ncbi:transmembrane protein 135-like isoform X2 [Prorops nasuta]
MPAKLSKFTIDATCREYVHPWTSSCISSTAGLGLHALQDCIRIYTTVYVITLLMKGKVPSKDDIIRTILGIIQSTSFLSWSAFSYAMFICGLRRILGNFNVLTVSFIPSLLSSFSAILIERPSRRTLLSLYVSNIATETLFRMGVWRGYFSVIPKGEIYIFAVSTAVLMYFFRSKSDKKDSIYKIIRLIIGQYEEQEYKKMRSLQETCDKNASDKTNVNKKRNSTKARSQRINFEILSKALNVYNDIITRLKSLKKHITCPHPHSCAHYILMGSARTFSYGICGQLILKLALNMRRIIKQPNLIKSTIFKKNNLNLAVFLSGFVGLYRLVSCSLRRAYNKDSSLFAIPASLVASVAFMVYPDNSVALYSMWKALQLIWNEGVEQKKVPEVKWFVIFLYCFSTAVLFHAAIIEPQNLRPSYWKFLYNLSGGR